MAYRVEKPSGDIVINSWENGIAESPYLGISDMKNVQLVSVPKEASVNFSTSLISPTAYNGTMSAAGGTSIVLTGAQMDNGQAIQFSVLNDVTKGLTLVNADGSPTTYWVVFVSGTTYQLFSDYKETSAINVTGAITGTWATVNMSQPKYFSYAKNSSSYWMVDSHGFVWTNLAATPNQNWWRYTGNAVANGYAYGNGLAYYQASDGTGYMFVFSDGSIDYTPTTATTVSWVYQWNWKLGTIIAAGAFNANPTNQFKATGIHETFLAPDNVVYFCDGAWIGRWFEQTGKVFLPTDITTYVADETRLLPFNDTAQCLSFLGTSIMIGGKNNVIYPWDTTSPTFSYPLLLSEYNIVKMVTVNTNMFIFVGNRGRIYYTNGTNAQLYKKIPDHISGTIEPYFTWGGACSNKNQLYFSALVKTNAGTVITTYGGLWGIDLDTKGIRLTNTLSYQTTVYNGYATAMIPNFGTAPAGTGLYIGWDSNSSTYGIDTTSSSPYTGGTAVAKTIIDSDLIPIGTFLKPTSNGRVEFKLAMPLVANESVQLFYRQKFSDDFMTKTASSGPVGPAINTSTQGFNGYSWAYTSVNFQNSQWLQIRAVLISTASSPSYCRLTEMRVGQN